MQVSVIRADNRVVIDQIAFPVDCSQVNPLVHAVQWDDEAREGHIEFAQLPGQPVIPNVRLVEFKDYEFLRAAWHLRRDEIEHAAREVDRLKAESERANSAMAALAADPANGEDRLSPAREKASGLADALRAAVERLSALQSRP